MNRNNSLVKLLMAFLILMFLGGIAVGAVYVLSAEGQDPPDEVYRQSLTRRPESEEDIIAYLNTCVDYAKAEQTKLDVVTKLTMDDDDISFGENGEMLEESFVYIKQQILDYLENQCPKSTFNFGEDFSSELWGLPFTSDLIADAQSEEGKERKEGEEREIREKRYSFSVTFPDEQDPFGMNGVVNETFHMSESEEVLNNLWASYNGFATIDNLTVSCTGLQVSADTNRLTDKIDYITYTKKFNIKADITFLGELVDVGSKKLSFSIVEETSFNFTWANLACKPDTLKLKKGDIKVVDAIVTAAGDIEVRWSSSAPDVASVDSEGYVDAKKISVNPVIITAEFDFLGKTYTDTCRVTVTVPVTKVHLSTKKLTLSIGGEQTLEASVKPNDATKQDVLWSSKNPEVATVDSNGKVTAVAVGATEIVVLSKDGYYKITCVVTVTG